MTSSSRDPAAIPTRRDPLTAQLAAITGVSLLAAALFTAAVYNVVTAWLGGTS
jgi:hypothetical protein